MNKTKFWTQEEIEFLKNNYDKMEYADIAKIIGRTRDSVFWKAKDLGLKKVYSWTEEELKYLKDNYETKSRKEIAEYLNKTPSSIQNKAHKIGLIKPEKYDYDVNFFENIDTEEKAYWLGFIMADGYVHQTPYNAELGIELGIKDYNHLKKFNKSLHGNIEVSTRTRWSEKVANNKVQKYISVCNIRLYKKKIVEDIKRWGVNENKTINLRLPNIPDNLIIHLIRGYFDGDGSVFLEKNRNIVGFNCTSACKDFLEELREYLYVRYNINSQIYNDKAKDKIYNLPTYKLQIRGMTNAYNFGKLLYKDAHIYLDRKYERYYNIINEYDIYNRIIKNGKYNGRFENRLSTE